MTSATVASSCCGICAAVLTTGPVEGGLLEALDALHAASTAAGWGHDERGRVRCGACLATPAEAPELPSAPKWAQAQLSLLKDHA